MRDNHIPIIGLGNISRRHIKNMRYLFPERKIIGISSSGRDVSEEIGLDIVLDSVGSLCDFNCSEALVTSPASHHYKHICELQQLNISKIFVEKPIGASENCIKQFNNARIPNLVVGYCLRYLPSLKMLKKIISNIDPKDMYYVEVACSQHLADWRPGKDYRDSVSSNSKLGGGVLLELSHEIDYLKWLFGDLKVQCSSVKNTGQLDIDVEDLAKAVLVTKNGLSISLHLDFLSIVPRRSFSIFFREGVISWDFITGTITKETKNGMAVIFSDASDAKDKMYIDMLREFFSEKHSQSTVFKTDALKTLQIVQEIKNNADR